MRDIGDAVFDLDEVTPNPAVPAAVKPRARWRQVLPYGLAAVATGVAVAAVMVARRERPLPPAPVVEVRGADRGPFGRLEPGAVARRAVHGLRADRLYVHRFDRGEAQPLAGTEHAQGQFISRDGRWIGYMVEGKMRKIAVGGGEALTICDASGDLPGAAWGPGNTILFTPAWGVGLSMVSADGGRPETLTTPDRRRNEKGHWWPQLLPGGKRVLFTIWMAGTGINDAQIAVLDLDTKRYRVLFPGAMARYASGHVIFYRQASYRAVAMDETTLQTSGEPITLFTDARPPDAEGTLVKPLSLSDNGVAAYMAGAAGYPVVFDWVDREGNRTPSGATAKRFIDADLSPDGRKLAVSETSGGVFTLTVHDLERKTTETITDEGSNWTGRWAPDNERIAVTSLRKGDFDIYLAGSGGLRPVLVTELDESPVGWSPDGRLLFKTWLPDGTIQLKALNVSDSTATILVSGRLDALDGARVSPNGHWLSFLSTPSGQTELYALPFPAGGHLTRLSSDGAGGGWLAGPWVARGLWSAAAPEVFYRREEELFAVSYRESGGQFTIGDERSLLRLPAFELIGVAPDASRFLIAVAAGPPPSSAIDVVFNWPAQLATPAR